MDRVWQWGPLGFLRANGLYVLVLVWVVWKCVETPRFTISSWHQYAMFLSVAAVFVLDFSYQARRREEGVRWPGWMALTAIVAVVLGSGFYWMREIYPHLEQMLRVVMVALFVWYLVVLGWLRGGSRPQPLRVEFTALALVGVCVLGVFNYYKRTDITQVNDYYDVVFYYTNAKYFNELGYDYLYPALLLADEETKGQFKDVQRLRDLSVDRTVERAEYLTPALAATIKGRFTPERWEALKQDYLYFAPRLSPQKWKDFFTDHGFNPPATWTVAGGALANAVPIEYMKWLTMIDFALVAIMFVVVYSVFGFEACLFAMLWFTVSFSARAPILGQAFLRFDWSSCLVLAVCMLAARRPFLAGIFLAFSGLVRVFPLVFFWTALVEMWLQFRERRKLKPEQLWFLSGAMLMGVVLLAAILVFFGKSGITQSLDSLKLHADSYTSHRIGLGAASLFQWETSDREVIANGGIQGKKAMIKEMKPGLYLLCFLYLGLIALYMARVKSPLYRNLHWAIIPIFIATNAQINYYNLRLLLVIWHASQLGQYRHKLGLMMLFLIEAVTHYALLRGWPRYTVSNMTSMGLCVYFAFLTGLMVYEILRTYGWFQEEQVAGKETVALENAGA